MNTKTNTNAKLSPATKTTKLTNATKRAKQSVKLTAKKPVVVVPDAPHPLTDSPERFTFTIINYNKRHDAPMLSVKFGSDDLAFFTDNAITPANRTGGYQFIMVDETQTAPRKRFTKRYCAKFHAQTFVNQYNELHGVDADPVAETPPANK